MDSVGVLFANQHSERNILCAVITEAVFCDLASVADSFKRFVFSRSIRGPRLRAHVPSIYTYLISFRSDF